MTLADRYIIGQWSVEPALNRLSRLDDNGETHEIILVPKVMTLLQCLVDQINWSKRNVISINTIFTPSSSPTYFNRLHPSIC